MGSSHLLRSEQDVVEAIERAEGTTPRMRWVWVLGLGGIFFEAYSSAALGSALDPLTRELSLSPGQVALLTSMSMLIALFLCPVAGRLSDRFGRLPMILLAKALAVASSVMAVVVPDFALLVASRVLAGMSWALDFAVVMAYLAEFLPRRHQGKLNRWQGMWYVATTSNLLLTAGIHGLGAGEEIWRYSLGSAGVTALVLGILQWYWMPESPRWLATQERLREAQHALTTVLRVEVTETESGAECPVLDSAGEEPGDSSLRTLFAGPHRRRTVLACVTFMMQGLQYYAVGWYLPVIALQLFGADFTAATLGAAFFNVFGIIGGFGSTRAAALLRIRRAMQIGFAVLTVLLAVLGACFGSMPTWLAVTLPALFLLFHSAGPAPGGASLAALAYPSQLRALGSGLTNTAGSTGAAIGLFCYPLLQSALGPGGAIAATALVPLTGFITCTLIRWDPEADSADGSVPQAASAAAIG